MGDSDSGTPPIPPTVELGPPPTQSLIDWLEGETGWRFAPRSSIKEAVFECGKKSPLHAAMVWVLVSLHRGCTSTVIEALDEARKLYKVLESFGKPPEVLRTQHSLGLLFGKKIWEDVLRKKPQENLYLAFQRGDDGSHLLNVDTGEEGCEVTIDVFLAEGLSGKEAYHVAAEGVRDLIDEHCEDHCVSVELYLRGCPAPILGAISELEARGVPYRLWYYTDKGYTLLDVRDVVLPSVS